MIKPRRAILAVCALLALTLVAGSSADAAPKAKKAKPPKPPTGAVWMGAIERHGNHYDYVGPACPVDTQMCIAQVVRYRINPTTSQVRAALKRFPGGGGTISGKVRPANDRGHDGVLIAREITLMPTTPSTPATPGAPGETGQSIDVAGDAGTAP